jgi:hypothetical protein
MGDAIMFLALGFSYILERFLAIYLIPFRLFNMLPPKKSKAARSVHQEETQDEAKTEETKKDEMKKENVAPPEGHGDDEDVNIFKVEIVEGKRSRCLPAGEQSLQEW